MAAKLTKKELSALEDQMGTEQVLISKYHTYADSCTDPALKQKCKQISDRHQQHYDMLMGLLG